MRLQNFRAVQTFLIQSSLRGGGVFRLNFRVLDKLTDPQWKPKLSL